MRNLKNEWKNKKVIIEKLLSYGFEKKEGVYQYRKLILGDSFCVEILYDGKEWTSKVMEKELDEEYLMVDIEDATGEFVGEVKEEYQKVIDDMIKHCTEQDSFQNEMTQKIIQYVKETYQSDLEFLWEKYPNYGIWRNSKNGKWYGGIFVISSDKLGEEEEKEIEILNVRYQKGKIEEVVDGKSIFPGYHMNKKSWITIKLDGSVDFETVKNLVDNSYQIIDEKNRK